MLVLYRTIFASNKEDFCVKPDNNYVYSNDYQACNYFKPGYFLNKLGPHQISETTIEKNSIV